MLERGYADTTVDEICALAGLSKGSFYHFFNSKEAMGLAMLDRANEVGIKRWFEGPFMAEHDAKRRLMAFLLTTEENSPELWGKGCLLSSLVTDLATTHPSIRQRVAEQFTRIIQRLSVLFQPLAAPGGGQPTAADLAESYLGTLEGAVLLARAFQDPERIRQVLTAFRRQLRLNID